MIEKLIHNIFGQPEEDGFDNYLLNVLCLIISTLGFIATLINIYLELSLTLVISTLALGIAFAAIFLLSRFRKKLILNKYILIILSIIFINFQWILNFGTHGPGQYLFVVIECFVIILFKKWESIIFTCLVIANITILFLIEYSYPNIFGKYTDDYARLTDLYTGMLIYLTITILLINIAFNFYIKAKDKAENADKLKTSFLANISHEIRTPMNAIIGFGELLNETIIDKNQKKYLEIINSNSCQLLKLIDDIIDISKIESNQLNILIDEFSIQDLFKEIEPAINQLLKKYNKQHIQLICNAPKDNFIIRSDYSRIKQVLNYLLSNAVKFTEQGSIVYGCTTNELGITFYVQDTGIGIKSEHLEEIFLRFKKIDTAVNNKVYRGSGLGLPISKKIVEMLNGKIWVESLLGKGSKFNFTIPTEIIKVDALVHEEEKLSTNLNFSGELILVAEDEDDNFYYLQEIIKRQNIKIIRANNGIEAIELTKIVQGISLILMDIKMPRMDGETAAREIKREFPKIPIIAQTSYTLGNDKEYFLKNNFDGYISKPIKPSQLFAIIDQYIIRK